MKNLYQCETVQQRSPKIWNWKCDHSIKARPGKINLEMHQNQWSVVDRVFCLPRQTLTPNLSGPIIRSCSTAKNRKRNGPWVVTPTKVFRELNSSCGGLNPKTFIPPINIYIYIHTGFPEWGIPQTIGLNIKIYIGMILDNDNPWRIWGIPFCNGPQR